MKKVLLTILVGFLFAEVFSQQTYQYRYHIFDDYLLNPAYVGTNDYYSIQIAHDQRFRGLSNSTPLLILPVYIRASDEVIYLQRMVQLISFSVSLARLPLVFS